MKKALFLTLVLVLLQYPLIAFAETVETGKPINPGWKHTHGVTVHNADDYDLETQAGVGADILLYDNEKVDVLAEYKYDINNSNNSIYAVVRTKKSLWKVVKGLLNKE